MNEAGPPPDLPWSAAARAAALLAVDPCGLGGATLRALAGSARERWLDLLRQLLPPSAPVRRIPVNIGEGRLLGGLDLAATLRAGRPVLERGLLAELDGGVALVASAERLAPTTAAHLAAALDTGEAVLERDGFAARHATRFAVVALDEGVVEDERPPAALLDRLAFHIDFDGVSPRHDGAAPCGPHEVAAARARLNAVEADDAATQSLCAAAAALGIASLRAPLLALRAARAAAALAGRSTLAEADVAEAARLVLAPRAAALPVAEPPEQEGEATADEAVPSSSEDRGDADARGPDERSLDDVILQAAAAAIPADLLARLRLRAASGSAARASARAGADRRAGWRGRPAGVRPGTPRQGARLSLVETLRAAAPWQPLRRAVGADSRRIEVRPDDLRVRRFKKPVRTTTIFAVDASGSAAFHRLAEAKGAVELVLGECYVRRDQVALLAFRGRAAELLLPPTRSLVRAKRSLAGLPGGGGTPLASGIDAAAALADAVRRRGETPVIILLTDGRANVGLDGVAGRPRAEADALAAARRLRAAGFNAVMVDTAPQPQEPARRLAEAMGARYLPLPYADAASLSRAVRALQR